MAVRPIPEGYNTLTPYLAVEDAARAIEFYKDAFGAEETVRMPGPGGTIGHAELQIGDSKLMLSDPFPQSTVRPPAERGGPTASVFMYVDDADAVFEQAQTAGATVSMPLKWSEVRKGLDPPKFTIRTMAKRLDSVGDLWKPVLGQGIDLARCLERLESYLKREAD